MLIPDILKNGLRAQESRLRPALIFVWGPLIGLFMFGKFHPTVLCVPFANQTVLSGWSANKNIHWIVSVIGITIYALTVYIISQCLFVYIPMSYPQYAASLFAGNDLCRSAFAFAAILFARPMFLKLGIGRGVSLLAGLSVLGIVSSVPVFGILQAIDPSYCRLGCGSSTFTVRSCGRDRSLHRSKAQRLFHPAVKGNVNRGVKRAGTLILRSFFPDTFLPRSHSKQMSNGAWIKHLGWM